MIKEELNPSAVGTLVERNTRLLILVKLPYPHPATAAHGLQALLDMLNAVAQPMQKTLTYDRGTNLSIYGQEHLDAIADRTNGWPGKTLDWGTPHEIYCAWLAKLEDSAQPIQ